jgi:Uma2 family endonuclease
MVAVVEESAGIRVVRARHEARRPGHYNELVAGSDDVRPAVPGVKLTYDDYLLLPDDGRRHELIDGEHYVTPSPVPRHQEIALNLAVMIRNGLASNPVGRVYVAPLDVVFSEFDVVEPDLLFVASARVGEVLTDRHVRGAPDLVVEIGSPGTRKRDETVKRRLYERFGVSEYWVIDPELETVRVFRRAGEGYTKAAELRCEDDDTLTTPLMPGIELPLVAIFAQG